jgi:hypothetical protein
VTGLLFLWGIIRAVKRWKERRFFYCLSGLFVMALPGLLTSADAPASHTTGMIPFLAYLCAAAFMDLWNSLYRTSPVSKTIAFSGAFVLLAWMAGSNFYDYFSRQARDPAVCSAFYPGATAVGERLNRAKEKGVFLSPKFFRNNNVEFLNYRQSAAFQRLDFWNLPGKGATVIGEDSIFVLDEGKTGFLRMLQFIFPGGAVEKYEYFKGWPLVYFYRIKAGTSRLDTPSEGIRGTYRLSRDWESSPAFTRADPVLNFTFRNDFDLTNFPPLSIRWKGRFSAEKKGEYVLQTLTTDSSALWVDGKKVLEGLGPKEGRVLLAPGRHSIRVEFQKLEGKDTAFTLLWLSPGAQAYQVVPFWSFKP